MFGARHLHPMTKARDGPDAAYIQSLRVHIRPRRRKIEVAPEDPAPIVTEPAVGSRFLAKARLTAAADRRGRDMFRRALRAGSFSWPDFHRIRLLPARDAAPPAR